MSENTQIIIGNLTADPELRYTPSGSAVVNFTIASTPRVFDKETNEWQDGKTLFMRCSLWREAAENFAESFQKGNRVIAQGRLNQRDFETSEGANRTVIEMDVDEVGASVRFNSLTINPRNGGGRQPANAPAEAAAPKARASKPANKPAAAKAKPAVAAGGGW